MTSQTAKLPRRPDNQRTTRSGNMKKYAKQTARVEARRDGKPLAFGWGGHLSHSQKVHLQRRVIWSVIIAFSVLIVAVVVGFWVNINVIVPGLPITSVNGHAIPQSDYRKLLAVKAQFEFNTIYGTHGLTAQRDNLKQQVDVQQKIIDDKTKQIDSLNKQIQALPTSSTAQLATLNSQLADTKTTLATAQKQHDTLDVQYQQLIKTTIPSEQQLYTQFQLGNDSANWLQDNELIREWLAKQSATVQGQIEPSSSAVDKAVKDFAANIPKTSSYSKFLSNDNVSDGDVHGMMALKLRRDNMQTYLASQITSPTYQVSARAITLQTQKDADDIVKQMKQGADFGKLTSKSVDTNTKSKGGALGWLARGQYTQNYGSNLSGVIDNWIFDPARKINEMSPVLAENGTFHVVQILGIDSARAVDSATLQKLKDNALTAWLLSQKAMPGVKITTVDQDKLLDPTNIPPDLRTSTTPGQTLPPGAPPNLRLPPGGSLPPGTGTQP